MSNAFHVQATQAGDAFRFLFHAHRDAAMSVESPKSMEPVEKGIKEDQAPLGVLASLLNPLAFAQESFEYCSRCSCMLSQLHPIKGDTYMKLSGRLCLWSIRNYRGLVIVLLVMAAATNPSFAQVCDAQLINALKTRIRNYDHLVETRTLSTHYCSAASSASGINFGGAFEGVPIGGAVNLQSMQNACQTKNETYFYEHHKEFEMSYVSDAALALCKKGLSFSAQRNQEETTISVRINFEPDATAEFARLNRFDYTKDAMVCKNVPKRGARLFKEEFTCDITNPHKTINITLNTIKHGSRSLQIPRSPVKETKIPSWSFVVGCGNMGWCFQCQNEFGKVGPQISCDVGNDPCLGGRDTYGASRRSYCAARFYPTYSVFDKKYAVIYNREDPVEHRPTIVDLVTPLK